MTTSEQLNQWATQADAGETVELSGEVLRELANDHNQAITKAVQAARRSWVAQAEAPHNELAAENARLREELDRLRGGEPVAWSWFNHGRHVTVDKVFADELIKDGAIVFPLYIRPARQAVPNNELKASLGAMCAWFESLAKIAGWTPENAGSAWAGYRKAKELMMTGTAPQAVPDAIREALQRLIENGLSLGPASADDATLVASYRDRMFAAKPKPPAAEAFDEQKERWRHDAEDLSAFHNNLDEAGVPRADEGGAVLSEWGRVLRYKPAQQAVPEGWREKIEAAMARAAVFDDGSDGADAESAQSVVAILQEVLTAAPQQQEPE